MLPPTGREKGFALPGLTLHRLGTRTKPPENPAEPAGNPRPRKRGGRSGRPRRNLIQSGLETPPHGAIILPATGRRKGFRHAVPNVGVKPLGAHSDIRFDGGLPAPWGLNVKLGRNSPPSKNAAAPGAGRETPINEAPFAWVHQLVMHPGEGCFA